MEPYEVKFSGEIIRVDDSHVIVGEDFFKLEDLGGARVTDTTRMLRKAAWIACLLSLIALVTILVFFFVDFSLKENGVGLWVLVLFSAGLGGVFVAALVGGLAMVCGAKNIEETTRTFSLIGKNGVCLVTLNENYRSDDVPEGSSYKELIEAKAPDMKRLVAEIERRIQK